MTIPDDIAEDIDPADQSGGCLLPTGDGIKGGGDDE